MKTFELRSCLAPNQAFEAEMPQRKRFDFIGVGKYNKGKSYRGYGDTTEDAILGICTYYRISPKDIVLVK
jgi:hypothetical protein